MQQSTDDFADDDLDQSCQEAHACNDHVMLCMPIYVHNCQFTGSHMEPFVCC